MTRLPPDDESAIRALVGHASDAQFDADALAALHTEDAVVVNVAGLRKLGRDAFHQAASAALAGSLRDVRTSVDIVDIRPITDSTALVSLVKHIHDERPGSTADLPREAAMSYVVARDGRGWPIALAHTTPIAG